MRERVGRRRQFLSGVRDAFNRAVILGGSRIPHRRRFSDAPPPKADMDMGNLSLLPCLNRLDAAVILSHLLGRIRINAAQQAYLANISVVEVLASVGLGLLSLTAAVFLFALQRAL